MRTQKTIKLYPSTTIAGTIEFIRSSLNLSQEDLARILNVSVRTIVRWEKEGDQPPSLEKERLELIQEVVGIAGDIMDLENIPGWFSSPKESFSGLRPLDLLSTFRGIKRVQDSLEKVRWGVF
ncbi:MAG: helix-turn-helix domain-containing protein [Nitrospirae bacterium]|nr:helix-turn-helix domain-containing protein [Nitrospirota bacterium]